MYVCINLDAVCPVMTGKRRRSSNKVIVLSVSGKPKIAVIWDDIPFKLLKECRGVVVNPLKHLIPLCHSVFPDLLKITEIIPVYKK